MIHIEYLKLSNVSTNTIDAIFEVNVYGVVIFEKLGRQ